MRATVSGFVPEEHRERCVSQRCKLRESDASPGTRRGPIEDRMATMTLTPDDAVPRGPLSARLTTPQVWGIVLLAPYMLVFLAFVVYPVGYGLWLARHPASYVALYHDPIFARAAVNTLIFLVIGINFKMLVALFLSGFFIQDALLDQMAVGAVHPALGGAVDPDHPVGALHAQSRMGHGQSADLQVHRRGRPELAQRSHHRADHGDRHAHLEIAAVLDPDPDDRTAGDPAAICSRRPMSTAPAGGRNSASSPGRRCGRCT